MNEDMEEDDIDDLLYKSEEQELKSIVSVSDKYGEFSWEQLKENNEDFRVMIWGEMIENSIIEPTGNKKYELIERSRISDYLSEDNTKNNSSNDDSTADIPDIDYESTSWSRRDKLVGAAAMVSMSGFALDSVGDLIYGVLSLVLNPLLSVLPFLMVMFIIALGTSIWSTLVRERIIDTNIDELRDHLNQLRGDDSGGMFSKPNDEDTDPEDEEKMMQIQHNMMKSQIKPFGWIMVVTIPMIIWIITTVNAGGVGTVVYPLIGELPWASTVFGPIRTWILWYASCSIVMNQAVKNLADFSD